MRAALLTSLWLASAAGAQELSLGDLATAERDEKAALKRVEAAHGNRPPQELSAEERTQIVHEQQEASRAVFEARGIDPKTFAARQMRLTPQERGQVEAEKKRLDDAEEAARKARAAAANAEAGEVEITRGVDEKHPVDVYRAPGEVEVENLQDEGAVAEPPPGKPQKGHKAGKLSAGKLSAGPPQKSSRGKKSRRK